jgi:hypothetical protein
MPMAFVAETHLAEGQEWRFVNIKKSKAYKISIRIHRPTIYKRVIIIIIIINILRQFRL